MSEIGDKIQEKCEAFGDRVIKLNDYLLEQECKKENERCKKGSRIPITLKSVAALSNQLLRAGTSIGSNNAEPTHERMQSQACLSYAEREGGRRSQPTNAISKADFKSKSFIALKEARESLYWIKMLHRNNYIDDKQFESIYEDCEELVRVLVHRCKKLNEE